MSSQNKSYNYLSDKRSFISYEAAALRTVYFPLCGTTADSIKSSITPFLSGDIKINKERYLTKPVSTEDLRNPLRNFFVYVEGRGIVSMAESGEKASVEAGQIWHKVKRAYLTQGVELEALNFVPVTGEQVELMRLTCRNITRENLTITSTTVIPLFARALANKHDHEHVTSLLHRTTQLAQGVLVEPSMTFNEEGHNKNNMTYYVFGVDDQGNVPGGTFPTMDSFYGIGGTPFAPEAVTQNISTKMLSEEEIQGKEAIGALRFTSRELSPGEEQSYVMMIGAAENQEEALRVFNTFNSLKKFENALDRNKAFWSEKMQGIVFETGDPALNSWMRWVTLQPVLRRIYGCSFLPDHDYGKGGKGWRDIWQDLLSLILIEPRHVREVLINNFAGVRIDGSNATIIGSAPGEFIADRNAITRVWMDHGVWPFMTLLLYINQTGDYKILLEENTYFRDAQLSRAFEKDTHWTPEYGNFLKDTKHKVYQGTLLEHILVQHLVQFFNVGEHNIIRLESADWNDGLDMAFDRGESAAFMSCYGGNLLKIADMLEDLSEVCNVREIMIAKEIASLLDSLTDKPIDYENIEMKKKFLFETYFSLVQPALSGEKVDVMIKEIGKDLRKKSAWIFDHIRKQEKITVDHEGFKDSWFNGYYDNNAQRVEGIADDHVRMTLTGQVFPIMSGAAEQEDVKKIVAAVKRYLQDRTLGGVRLNSDFGLKHYLDLGRAFGFAYGTKENGAFFSHMIVMYAYALYYRGFSREGYEVLNSIYQMSIDIEKSKIYPGIPEYFDSEGKGMYHYLTGSASWLVLTQLTQVFGVRGEGGDLVLAPALVREEFNAEGRASVICQFAEKKLTVIYENCDCLDVGSYLIKEVSLNDHSVVFKKDGLRGVKIKRDVIEQESSDITLRVVIG